MAGARLYAMTVAALFASACGPIVESAATGTDATTSQDETGPGGSSPDGDTGVGTANAPEATTVGTGCLDGCGTCPQIPCRLGEYCDAVTGTCLPVPSEIPACDAADGVVGVTTVPLSFPAMDLTFVDVDGVPGREIVTLSSGGRLETLAPPPSYAFVNTSSGHHLGRIFAADANDDGFGDLMGPRPSGWGIVALVGEGTGCFNPLEPSLDGEGFGHLVAADWSLDGRPDAVYATPDSLRTAWLQPTGFVDAGSTPVSSDAQVVVTSPGEAGTGTEVVAALWDGTVTRYRIGADGSFTALASAVTQAWATDAAGFFAVGGAQVYTAVLEYADHSVVLEIFDETMTLVATWSLPEIGSSRRVAAFPDPWNAGDDLLVVFGTEPQVQLVIGPWEPLPCTITLEAGPATGVGLGYTTLLLTTEDAELLQIDFP